MGFSKVILKSRNNKIGVSKRKFMGGTLYHQHRVLEQPAEKVRDAVDVQQISKQVSNLHINRKKPITLKL